MRCIIKYITIFTVFPIIGGSYLLLYRHARNTGIFLKNNMIGIRCFCVENVAAPLCKSEKEGEGDRYANKKRPVNQRLQVFLYISFRLC